MNGSIGHQHRARLARDDDGNSEGNPARHGVYRHADALKRGGIGTCGTSYHRIRLTGCHHASGKDIAVLIDQALAIALQEAIALALLIEKLRVTTRRIRKPRILDFNAIGQGNTNGIGHRRNAILAPHQDRRAIARIAETNRGTDNLFFFTFRKYHALRVLPHAFGNGFQRAHCRIQPIRQIARIALQIRQGLARHAAIHRSLGNSGRNARNQARIEGIGDDVFRAEAKRLARTRARDFFRHIFPRQHGQRFSSGNFHRVIDGRSAHIQGATENKGKAQNIIDLVRVIRTPGRDNAIRPRRARLIRGDFRIGVSHGENDRLWRHGADHLRRQRALHRQAKEHIRAIQGLRERAGGGGHRMGGFPLIHAFLTATPDHALRIA